MNAADAAEISKILRLAPEGEAGSRYSDPAVTQPRKPAVDLGNLTRAVRRGDEAAFIRLYDLYSLRIYKHLLVLAKGNEADAREVMQAVMIKLAGRCEVFDEEHRFWAWLRKLSCNAYIDLCRTRKRDQCLAPLEEHAGTLAEPEVSETDLCAALREIVGGLPAEEGELLRAAYVDRRPLQELANEAGQSYKAIESRLGRLRQKIKTELLNRLKIFL